MRFHFLVAAILSLTPLAFSSEPPPTHPLSEKQEFSTVDESTIIENDILKVYESELSNPGSPISVAIEKYKRSHGIPEKGLMAKASEENLWEVKSGEIDHGKFEAHDYYFIFLLGVPVTWSKGGGEYAMLIQVRVDYSMVNEKHSIQLLKFVDLD